MSWKFTRMNVLNMAIVGHEIKSNGVELTSGDVREGSTTVIPPEGISLTSSLHKMVHS